MAAAQPRDGDVEQLVTWTGTALRREATQPETRALAQKLREALGVPQTPTQSAVADRRGASLDEVVCGSLRA